MYIWIKRESILYPIITNIIMTMYNVPTCKLVFADWHARWKDLVVSAKEQSDCDWDCINTNGKQVPLLRKI